MEDPKTGEERQGFAEDDPERYGRAGRQPEIEGHRFSNSSPEEQPEGEGRVRRSEEQPEVEGHRFTSSSPEDPQRAR